MHKEQKILFILFVKKKANNSNNKTNTIESVIGAAEYVNETLS